jgi:hypothetical protein
VPPSRPGNEKPPSNGGKKPASVGAGTQIPPVTEALHCCWGAQLRHSAAGALCPHCCVVCCEAGTQAPEPWSQQPLVQVDGLQLPLDPQAWFTHEVPLTEQSEQKSPVRPQSAVCVPDSQRPVARSMQPLHGWQVPDTQDCRCGHAMHTFPPKPHRAVVGTV